MNKDSGAGGGKKPKLGFKPDEFMCITGKCDPFPEQLERYLSKNKKGVKIGERTYLEAGQRSGKSAVMDTMVKKLKVEGWPSLEEMTKKAGAGFKAGEQVNLLAGSGLYPPRTLPPISKHEHLLIKYEG